METSEAAAPESWEQVDQPEASEPEASPPASEPEPAPETPEAPAPSEASASPAPGTEATAVVKAVPVAPAPETKQPTAPAAAPAEETRPFGFRVDRQQIDVPGAVETNDGLIVLNRQAWQNHVQPYLADWKTWKRERTELLKQIAERDPEKNPVVQQARLLIGEIEKLKQQGPEAVVDWALNFLQQMPVLEANARAAAAEAKSKQYVTDRDAQAEQQIIEHYQREIPKNLREEIGALLKIPEIASLGLNADDLFETLWDMRHAIYFEAPEDMPEHGLRKGDIGVRRDVIRRQVGRYAQFAQQRSTAAAEVAKAKEQNARALNGGTPAPPAVTTKDSPAPGGKKAKKPSNYDEWIESLG